MAENSSDSYGVSTEFFDATCSSRVRRESGTYTRRHPFPPLLFGYFSSLSQQYAIVTFQAHRMNQTTLKKPTTWKQIDLLHISSNCAKGLE
jgi:hypothetical protein